MVHAQRGADPVARMTVGQSAADAGDGRADTEQVVGAVVVSGAAQFGAKIVLFVLNVVAALAIVRYLGPSGYGDYIFVLSFAAVFGLLSELGLNKVVTREMSRDPAAIPGLVGTAIVGQLLLAVLGWVAAQLAFTLIEGHGDLRAAVAIASLLYFTEAISLSLAAIFQVRLALQYDAVARVVAQALDTALILWLISAGAGLLWLIAAPVLTGAIGVLVAAVMVYLRFRTALRVDLLRLPPLLREALPVGLTSIVVIAYLRLDSVLLGILGTSEDVGFYGAASRPVEYLILALAVLVNVMFPLLARWYGVDPRRFAALYAHGASALLAVSVPIAVTVLVFCGRGGDAALPIRLRAFGRDPAPARGERGVHRSGRLGRLRPAVGRSAAHRTGVQRRRAHPECRDESRAHPAGRLYGRCCGGIGDEHRCRRQHDAVRRAPALGVARPSTFRSTPAGQLLPRCGRRIEPVGRATVGRGRLDRSGFLPAVPVALARGQPRRDRRRRGRGSLNDGRPAGR